MLKQVVMVLLAGVALAVLAAEVEQDLTTGQIEDGRATFEIKSMKNCGNYNSHSSLASKSEICSLFMVRRRRISRQDPNR